MQIKGRQGPETHVALAAAADGREGHEAVGRVGRRRVDQTRAGFDGLRTLPCELCSLIGTYAHPIHPCKWDIDAYEWGDDQDMLTLAQEIVEYQTKEAIADGVFRPIQNNMDQLFDLWDAELEDAYRRYPGTLDEWNEHYYDLPGDLWVSRLRHRWEMEASRPSFGPSAPYPKMVVLVFVDCAGMRAGNLDPTLELMNNICGKKCRGLAVARERQWARKRGRRNGVRMALEVFGLKTQRAAIARTVKNHLQAIWQIKLRVSCHWIVRSPFEIVAGYCLKCDLKLDLRAHNLTPADVDLCLSEFLSSRRWLAPRSTWSASSGACPATSAWGPTASPTSSSPRSTGSTSTPARRA
jgi:hypothetical protein